MPKSSSLLYYVIFISLGFLYPAYCSLVALETPSKADDKAWLMYWVIFALFHIAELFADYIFFWMPLYPLFKLGFVAWCVAPISQNGAEYIYRFAVAPFFHLYSGNIKFFLDSGVELMNNVSHYIAATFK